MSSSAPSSDIDHYATIETYLKYMADNPDPALVRDDPNGNDVTAVNGNLDTGSQKDDEKNKEEKKEEIPIIKTADGKYLGEEECQQELEQWARDAQTWGKEHGFKDRGNWEEEASRQRDERRRRKQYGRPLE